MQIGPYVLSALALGVVVWYLSRSDLLRELEWQSIEWRYAWLVVLAEGLAFAFRGLALAVYVEHLGPRLNFLEWFGLSIMSTVSNLLIPVSGGMMARAGYLKARYRFPVSYFSALLAASYLMIFLVSGLSGLIILGVVWVIHGAAVEWLAVVLLVGMAVGPLVLMLIPVERIPLQPDRRIIRWLRSALEGWGQIRANRSLLLKQLAVITLQQLVQAASLFFSLRMIQRPVPYTSTLLMGVLANLATFVRITPGALGIREGVTGLAAELVGLSAAQGLSAALVSRLGQTAIIVVLGPVFAFVLARYAQLGGTPGPDGTPPLDEAH